MTYLMEFGKYKGFPLHLIPNQYFTFLFESKDNMALIKYPTLYCKTHKELAKIKPDFEQRLNLQCECRKKSYSVGYLTRRKDYKGDYEDDVCKLAVGDLFFNFKPFIFIIFLLYDFCSRFISRKHKSLLLWQ